MQKSAATRKDFCVQRQETRLTSRCGNDSNAAVVNNTTYSEKKKIIDIKETNGMNNIALTNQTNDVQQYEGHFTSKQIEILKNSICKGISDEEFEVFLMACQSTKLNPFMKQIHAIPRKFKDKNGNWVNSMTIQTSIDGYRLIAERTGKYAPGEEPTYKYDMNGKLESATSYIKKLTADGTWHTVSASAHFDEYCQCFVDKSSGEKKPTGLWVNMPRTMLAKCAEAQALRKAFPAEMSGLYTKEEMMQADVEDVTPVKVKKEKEVEKITADQANELQDILDQCSEKYRMWVLRYMVENYNKRTIFDLDVNLYARMKKAALNHIEEEKQYHLEQSISDVELISEEN